jgi:hypothetical protein
MKHNQKQRQQRRECTKEVLERVCALLVASSPAASSVEQAVGRL